MFLVYRDEGVDSEGVSKLCSALPNYAFANRNTFQTDRWQKNCSLLIFPGGRDRPYHKALQGRPNQGIKSFVEQGGHFLGICAGGYYGAQSIEFEQGGPLEIIEKRELAFFPGIAQGPAYGKGLFRYESTQGARIAHLSLHDGTTCKAYFNGGPLFVQADTLPNIKVLARYKDIPQNPAAIIQCNYGKGRAILSGVHPEYYLEEPLFSLLLTSFLGTDSF